jgi:aminopeptidase N
MERWKDEKKEGWEKRVRERRKDTRSSRVQFLLILPSFLLLIFSLFALGQTTARFYHEPEYGPAEHQVDMQHMRLEVSFVPQQGLVKGKVTHIFTPIRPTVDSLFFNGPGIRVHRAFLNGKPVPFTLSGEGVTVKCSPPLSWKSTDSITFEYEATPRRGIYFVGWNDITGRSRKQVWTQGQGIDNRHWIPCYDEQNDKLTTETIVTFDRAYSVLSNGKKMSERDNGNGTKTWHYRMSHPHSIYLVMLGIGRYAIDNRRSKSGVPLHLWYYPEYPDRVEPTYRYSAEMTDFMEMEAGVPFPWESYSQIPVQDFLHGAMENTTATVFGDFSLVDRRAFLDKNYVATNIHELAHQWFGDYVTARSGLHSWLHESFATLYPKLFLRTVYGEEYYQWYRRNEQNVALEASKRDSYPILHSRAGADRIYQKGSTVLEMMMYTFGEEPFRKVITYYLQKHAYGLVETNDLYQAFQDVLGITPQWFLEEWIYRGGEPHYDVSYREVHSPNAKEQCTVVSIRQIHPQDELVKLFRMPIVFEVHYADGTCDSRRVMIEKETETVTLSNPHGKQIAFVLFDPGSMITKRVTFQRSFEELSAQASSAPNMIDRYDALVALRESPIERKRTLLVRRFRQETFHAPRTEIVEQLIEDTDTASVSVIQAALEDPSVEVRTGTLNATATISPSLRSHYERLLTDSSYVIVATALRKLSNDFPAERARYLRLTRGVQGVGNQGGILRHEILAGMGDTTSRDSLVSFASPAFEFRTRVNALEALKRINWMDDTLISHLFQAMLHPNGRLSGPAQAVVVYFLQQPSYGEKLRRFYDSRQWLPVEREILRPLFTTK